MVEPLEYGAEPSIRTPSSRVSVHAQAAVRGRVRAARTTSTTKCPHRLLAPQGQRPPAAATTSVATMEPQKAATGRTSVSATGIAGTTPRNNPSPDWANPRNTQINAAPSTSACGVHTSFSRAAAGSLRSRGPSSLSGGSGR